MVVFSLTGWSPLIPSEFLVFRRTRCILLETFSPTSLSLSSERLSNRLRLTFLRIPIPEGNYFPSFGLFRFRSPLLAESFLLSFPPGTKMFQFPGFPHIPMDSVYDNAYLYALSSLIRISAGLWIFAPLRSFSQLVTSFFGAMYQGILRMLFVA